MKFTLPLFVVMALLLVSCSGQIDGSSEKNFIASSEKIKSKLSEGDKIKFEKAMRLIALSAMREKFNHPENHKNESNNAIAMKMVNGKNYRGLIDLAENYLKVQRDTSIAELKAKIAQFKKAKDGYDVLKNKLSVIQGKFIKIDLVNGVPTLFCEFKNVSKKMYDNYGFQLAAFSMPKGTVLASYNGSYSGVGTLKPNDTLTLKTEFFHSSMEETPEIPWKTIKYPITDPAKYNIQIEAYADYLVIDDQTYNLNGYAWRREDEAAYNQILKEIKDLESHTPSLDDLELTEKR